MSALAKLAVDAGLTKAFAPLHAELADISARLDKINAAPWPLWMKSIKPANEALVDAREALAKSIAASPAMTDAALLARLMADPAIAARARNLDPGRLT